MASVYQTVISILSKPIENRDDAEISSILVWFTNLFRKKATVFGDISQEVIRDIIKNCSFETKKRDDIIIKQGDKGDCFYVNLHGKVSIYINHQHDSDLNDEQEKSHDTSIASEESSNETKNIREKLGNYVTSLAAGEGFGEVALVSDADRTASIIADETTDLMIVNKALYKRCLQAPALRKLAEKQAFIDQSPFFGNWSNKMKKLLCLCLEREIIRYDSYLGKQGELADKIYFIIKGEAKVTIDPTSHVVQYPRFYPLKLPENESQEIISTWIEEKNKNHRESSKIENQAIMKNSQAMVRRSFTFAEAEQRRKLKNIEVGIIGPGEISGLCEIIMDMPTYMQSTKCMEDCDLFFIYKRSYERLISKRNQSCVNKMMEYVYLKLQTRNYRLKLTNPIPFYRSIEYRLELLLHGRKKSINSTNGIQINKTGANNGLKLPPRGPIIQKDTRSKIVAKPKRRLNLNSTPNYSYGSRGEITDESFNSANSCDGDDQLLNKKENKNCDNINNKLLDYEFTSDQALNDLEERIKQWHFQNGCKNPLLETFHRIDVDKLKNNVKSGGKITMKPKLTLEQLNRNNTNSASGSSGFSSASGDSDDENLPFASDLTNDYKLNPMKMNRHNSIISANDNELNSFDEGFYNQQRYFQQRHSLQEKQTTTFESIINGSINNNNNTSVNSNKKFVKRRSLPIKLNDTNLQEIFNNTQNNTLISNNNSSNNKKRLSSFTNLSQRLSVINIQYTPYLFRKLSMSKVKVFNTSRKTYSKEEYLVLKDELKRQTRRHSMSSIKSSHL